MIVGSLKGCRDEDCFGVGMEKEGICDLGGPSLLRNLSDRLVGIETRSYSLGDIFIDVLDFLGWCTLGSDEVVSRFNTLGSGTLSGLECLHDSLPIFGMNNVEVRGVFHFTSLIDGGFLNGGGDGAARLSNSAMAWIACCALSPKCNEGNWDFGGFYNMVTISPAAWRRWSSIDVAGIGTVVGIKATVSEIRVLLVLGT